MSAAVSILYLFNTIHHRVSHDFIGPRNCVPMAFTAESPLCPNTITAVLLLYILWTRFFPPTYVCTSVKSLLYTVQCHMLCFKTYCTRYNIICCVSKHTGSYYCCTVDPFPPSGDLCLHKCKKLNEHGAISSVVSKHCHRCTTAVRTMDQFPPARLMPVNESRV